MAATPSFESAFESAFEPAFEPASKLTSKPFSKSASKPSFELRLRVLNAVHDAPGSTMRERIKYAATGGIVNGIEHS